jgi:hypothetical protein
MGNRSFRAPRRYSTASSPAGTPVGSQSQASMLATITTDLDKIAPRFEVQPEQIQILQTPAEFYETLKVSQFTCFPFSKVRARARACPVLTFIISLPQLSRLHQRSFVQIPCSSGFFRHGARRSSSKFMSIVVNSNSAGLTNLGENTPRRVTNLSQHSLHRQNRA